MSPPASSPPRDKARVAASFSRAAARYDDLAALQRHIGLDLLRRAGYRIGGQVLDLGCGTGYFSRRLAAMPGVTEVYALDLAEGMLLEARQRCSQPRIQWLAGDAEYLPLASSSLDAVYSSLVIQWCEDSHRLCAELARVLRPGGILAFATLGPQTLQELKKAWAAVDDAVHVNDFLPLSALETAWQPYFDVLALDQSPLVRRYAKLETLMRELKGIGAHNLNSGQSRGLLGRRRLATLKAAYEGFRDSRGQLPATYEVISGVLRSAE